MALKANHSRARFHSELLSEINVTPLVDVMLVLLVIFMVTAPMMTSGVNVDLPKTNAKSLAGSDEPLMVSITSNGKIYVQKTEVELKDLQMKLASISNQKKDTRIFLKGDRAVDYGRFAQVMGEINAAGYGRISLVSEVGASQVAPAR